MSHKHKLSYLTIWILASFLCLVLPFNSPLCAQTRNISGVINTVSARIDQVSGFNDGDVDSVHVNSVSGFTIGDTVMIHMTVGSDFFTDPISLEGLLSSTYNSGIYAIFLLKDIDVANSFLILNATLSVGFTSMVPGEYGQIIKVPTYNRAKITGVLTCNAYNPLTGTGGILVLMARQAVIFEEDINVDGKGFRGAVPDALPYNGNCSSSDTKYLRPYFSASSVDFSALKGGSPVIASIDSTRGNGAIGLGGGGGNGKYSGGGGGANYASGGKGGSESVICGGTADIGGKGGRAALGKYYTSNNRISLGGGGGTSLYSGSRIATSGGNGGGIVVIVSDSLIGNKKISARGQSVVDSASAGGGGGGGGGTIILHINKYSNSPDMDVSGGTGGSIFSATPEASGPGGGGGSGVVWHNGATIDASAIITRGGGENGKYRGAGKGAFPGATKAPIPNLIIPVRGFLFNYIPQADTICKGSPPQTINAAPPVGGTGIYTYNWLQSTDSLNWTDAAGTRNVSVYTPPNTINITMYYKRAVDNETFIHDTSNVSKMYVMPLIINNSISPDTTVCQNLKAGTLYPNMNITGGNGSYRYKWVKSADGTFATIDSVGHSAVFVTPVFTQSTWYRRIAYSGPVKTACVSISNTRKVTVLPKISNNSVDSSQEICIERTPDIITGKSLSGGAGAGSYLYKWQKKKSGNWTDTAVVTATFQPEKLFTDQQYRRIVISGLNNTCKDTSTAVSISVMDSISGNTLNPITQNILCSGLDGEIITANIHAGGNGAYNYYWQNNGIAAAGGNVENNFSPGVLTSNSAFRRIITSGANTDSLQRCHSISNIRTITVLEKITNNNLTPPAQTTWCQGKTPEDIAGLTPLYGQPGSYAYSWQRKFSGGNWADTAVIAKDFNTPVLIFDVSYRRIVKSGLNETCKDTSNFISFTMQDSLLNNKINDNLPVFVCFDEDSILQATFSQVITGGDEINYAYQWSQSSTANGIYADISGENDSLFQTPAIQSARYYKRKVTSGDCINFSKEVKVDPLPLPELTNLSLGLSEICFNKLYSVISASVQSGTLPYEFKFSDGRGFTDSRNFNTNTQSIQPVIDNPPINPGYINYIYNVVSIKDAKGCLAKPANLAGFSVTLKIFATPTPSRISAELEESCSSLLEISVQPSIGVSSWHLTKIKDITVDNTTNPIINLSASYTTNSKASVSLAYVENVANCPSDTIHVDAILYNNPDTIKNIYRIVDNTGYVVGDTLTIFISDNQMFKADTVIYGTQLWSINSGAGELSDPTLLSTNLTKLDQDDPTFLKYSISNGTCPVNSRIIKVERKELMLYDGFSPNDDGINDVLWAVGLADEEVTFKFQIFSSSGNFIRELTRKDIKEFDFVNNRIVIWDGSTNMGGTGNFVPEGTYYYVLIVEYHNQNFDKKGFIVVKR